MWAKTSGSLESVKGEQTYWKPCSLGKIHFWPMGGPQFRPSFTGGPLRNIFILQRLALIIRDFSLHLSLPLSPFLSVKLVWCEHNGGTGKAQPLPDLPLADIDVPDLVSRPALADLYTQGNQSVATLSRPLHTGQSERGHTVQTSVHRHY